MMTTLFGKSAHSGISLLRHTLDVVEAGDALFGTLESPTRLGECWLRFFKLDAKDWSRFYWNLLAAELTHDWGKANDGMQRVLRHQGEQFIRHEHFSAVLIGLPVVMDWLKSNDQIDVPLVLSAVLTHHLKAGAKENGWASGSDRARVTIVDHQGAFAELVNQTGTRLRLPPLDVTKIPEHWCIGGPPNDIREHRKRIQNEVLIAYRRATPEQKQMLTAVRAALIAADSAGSGYARTGHAITATLWRQFAERAPLTGAYIEEEVIDKRIKDIEKVKQRPFEFNKFQKACATLPDRALLLAPCGSGKTLAAWKWIAARAAHRPVGRVLFLYPTRATAKEGFRDYVSWAPEAEASLMHGTAAFDLQGMFDNGDARDEHSKHEADRRLFSLAYWPKRIFSATVDQFLGYLQYSYGPMCMLPVLADSVIVIDEVHSFDQSMFSALKGFLKNFNVPVLCMTATLPRDRIEALKGCGLELPTETFDDLQKIADMPRYQMTRVPSRAEVFPTVREALAAGKRVLWVANTVNRCHEITATFAQNLNEMRTENGTPVYCYHSRYKLSDRVTRHNEIVEALKVGRPGALGVTTQVCEMSLDLDVDLLVTEECPVTSMIQRMGRSNRERDARTLTQSGKIIVYKPDTNLPYSDDDLKGLNEFLDKLSQGQPLSQTVLENTLNDLKEIPTWFGDKLIMFLESGAYADGRKTEDEDANTFRDGNDFTRPCVLPSDVTAYHAASESEKPGFIVPVQRKHARARDDDKHPAHKKLPKYIGVAADEHYHPSVGYCDQEISMWGNK